MGWRESGERRDLPDAHQQQQSACRPDGFFTARTRQRESARLHGQEARDAQAGNPSGDLLRMRERSAGGAATSFSCDVYLFGAEAGADKAMINMSSLTADQDFSSPDGIAFSQSTGICWIQTDDGAYTDVTN